MALLVPGPSPPAWGRWPHSNGCWCSLPRRQACVRAHVCVRTRGLPRDLACSSGAQRRLHALHCCMRLLEHSSKEGEPVYVAGDRHADFAHAFAGTCGKPVRVKPVYAAGDRHADIVHAFAGTRGKPVRVLPGARELAYWIQYANSLALGFTPTALGSAAPPTAGHPLLRPRLRPESEVSTPPRRKLWERGRRRSKVSTPPRRETGFRSIKEARGGGGGRTWWGSILTHVGVAGTPACGKTAKGRVRRVRGWRVYLLHKPTQGGA